MVGIIATFAVVALLLSVVPGPDTLLVLRAGLRGGQRSGTAAGLGCAAGSLIWGGAAAVGLATLLERSAAAFEIVKLAGAVYLIFLGARALWDARRPGLLGLDQDAPAGPPVQTPAGAFLAVLAAVAGWALRWLRQARVRRAMEGTTGLCMVGLGATIALDHSL